MDEHTYHDASGRACPDCHSTNIVYVRIPKSVRINRDEEEEDTTNHDHFGPTRDYTCRNCDTEWNMDDVSRFK